MNDRILSPIIKEVKPKMRSFKLGSKIDFMKPDYIAIGGRIREARKGAGLTQTELAEMLELTQPAITAIESGIVSLTIDNLFVISQVLGQPMEYFLGVGSGELKVDEVQWLQLLRDTPEDVKPILFDLVQGYIGRVKQKGS